MISTERGTWTRAHRGVVGVSAVSGDHRFLEFPGQRRLVGYAVVDNETARVVAEETLRPSTACGSTS